MSKVGASSQSYMCAHGVGNEREGKTDPRSEIGLGEMGKRKPMCI